MPHSTKQNKVVIVGAGPVGVLAALYFSNRNWTVHVYDLRPDPSYSGGPEAPGATQGTKPADRARSINLALSSRGIEGLRGAHPTLVDRILSQSVPLKGRMLHVDHKGPAPTHPRKIERKNSIVVSTAVAPTPPPSPLPSFKQLDDDIPHLELPPSNTALISQEYGLYGECINSVDRSKLLASLIKEAKSRNNIKIVFGHRLKRCDFDAKKTTFEAVHTGQETLEEDVDLVLGADGSHSAVRGQLNRKVRMDFHQEYIDHAYVELAIPAAKDAFGNPHYAMDPNHLHIWPRQSFMMIALANTDYSFTNTLFMPWADFAQIKTPPQLLAFYAKHFPDAIPLMGQEALVRDFFNNPRGSLMSIKSYPYHYSSRCLIIGDAAHSMVPFYGQGMNCGFEDVRILNEILDEFNADTDDRAMKRALEAYTTRRHDDLTSICDLAMHNYQEMRSDVVSLSYKARRQVEGILHKIFPSRVVPLYTMVSFRPEIGYKEALDRWRAQGRAINISASLTAFAVSAAVAIAGYGWFKRR